MVATISSRTNGTTTTRSGVMEPAIDPMAADRERDRHRRCLITAGRKLYEGKWRELLIGLDMLAQHRYRLVRNHANQVRALMVKVNLYRAACKTHADILHNDPPTITINDDRVEQSQAWEEMADRCLFEEMAYEASLLANIESEAWIQILREDGHTCLAIRDAMSIFPVGPTGLDGQPRIIDRRWITTHRISGTSQERHFLRIERHSAPEGVGRVEHFAYEVRSSTSLDIPTDATRIDDLRVIFGDDAPPPVVETGVSRPLIFRICNSKLRGEPDPDLSIDDIDLIDQLAASMSQLVRTMAKHADPKMRIPSGLAEGDTNQVNAEDLEVVVDPNKELDYVDWQANLEQMLNALKEFANWLLIALEVSPSLMGIKPGAAPDSFDKLMLEATNTMKRANRVSNTRRPILERLITTALEFDSASTTFGYVVDPVSVTLHPGLPRSPGDRNRELAEMHAARQIDHQTMLEQIHGPEKAEEIMQRLAEEDASRRDELLGGLVGGMTTRDNATRDNAGSGEPDPETPTTTTAAGADERGEAEGDMDS